MDLTDRLAAAALVAAGGSTGAAVRWGVGEVVDGRAATVVVNVVGCALLAVVTAPGSSHRRRLALGGGFCGGLTTFSTFALDIVELLDDGRGSAALLYGAASLALGVLAFVTVRRTVAAS